MNVKIILDNYFKVYIDDFLHLCIKNNHIIGIQSWKETGINIWKIEYYIGDKIYLTEYDSKKKWESVLKELDKILLNG